ncbi:hypothetical protein [Spongiactinospora gelatinilytica]|nr:hypothetical protein [Spongiactinospora gelatinilytica]
MGIPHWLTAVPRALLRHLRLVRTHPLALHLALVEQQGILESLRAG